MTSNASDGVFCIQEGIVVNVNILKNSTLTWNPKSLTILCLLTLFCNYNIHETVNKVKTCIFLKYNSMDFCDHDGLVLGYKKI